MSMFESELENLLGEFHIKMKGETSGRNSDQKVYSDVFCVDENENSLEKWLSFKMFWLFFKFFKVFLSVFKFNL